MKEARAGEPIALRLWNASYTFWAMLAIPSLATLLAFSNSPASYQAQLHPTGEFAARFLVIALMITPLRMLMPGQGWLLWLQRRRRYLGVAAFGYALLHTVFYLAAKGSFSRVAAELLHAGIWTGWIAFLILVPLAVTSNDWAVHRIGSMRWKALQRVAYAAALLTLAHWLLVAQVRGVALVHFLPLAALEAHRVWANRRISAKV
jgi:sulfoxide reductase heme-binding subunit YedZ